MRGKSHRTIALEADILEVVEERAPITVRGVCYALFSRNLIGSMSTKETQRISRVMTDMRESGVLNWTLIVDGSRAVNSANRWDNPEQIIQAAVKSYRRDYWQDQPMVVEVWSEKSTIQGVLEPMLDEYGVTFRVMKGFGSFTAVKQAAEDSLKVRQGKRPIILYLGDFDPSGLYMSEVDLPKRLDRYGSEWAFQRIALTAADTASLPYFDAETKRGDKRFDWYADNHGMRAWELDAMNPVNLRERVVGEIIARLDADAWNHAVKVEQAEVHSMQEFHQVWKSKFRQISICPAGG